MINAEAAIQVSLVTPIEDEFESQFEPAAVSTVGPMGLHSNNIMSIAISLKRIADALERSMPPSTISPNDARRRIAEMDRQEVRKNLRGAGLF